MIRVKTADLMWSRVGEEVVVLDRRTDMYLGVNPTGAALWDLLVEGCTREQLVERVADRWGIPADGAARDVDDFLAGLRSEDLLEEADD